MSKKTVALIVIGSLSSTLMIAILIAYWHFTRNFRFRLTAEQASKAQTALKGALGEAILGSQHPEVIPNVQIKRETGMDALLAPGPGDSKGKGLISQYQETPEKLKRYAELFEAAMNAKKVGVAQKSRGVGKTSQEEQSSFPTDEIPGEPLLRRPVTIPDAVSEILKRDDGVKSCLENNPLPADEPLSTWFIASEIHLGVPNEADLVVLANPSPGEAYPCFHSAAGISWFWVFRRTAGRYDLILKAPGNELNVLTARHNGYKNIQTLTRGEAGRYVTTITFHFDSNRYLRYRETAQETR